MNKQLIKDNFEAFKHWLNSGKVSFYNTIRADTWTDELDAQEFKYIRDEDSKNRYSESSINWECSSSIDFPIYVVIQDQYLELRKASAIGKIIQHNIANLGYGAICIKLHLMIL